MLLVIDETSERESYMQNLLEFYEKKTSLKKYIHIQVTVLCVCSEDQSGKQIAHRKVSDRTDLSVLRCNLPNLTENLIEICKRDWSLCVWRLNKGHELEFIGHSILEGHHPEKVIRMVSHDNILAGRDLDTLIAEDKYFPVRLSLLSGQKVSDICPVVFTVSGSSSGTGVEFNAFYILQHEHGRKFFAKEIDIGANVTQFDLILKGQMDGDIKYRDEEYCSISKNRETLAEYQSSKGEGFAILFSDSKIASGPLNDFKNFLETVFSDRNVAMSEILTFQQAVDQLVSLSRQNSPLLFSNTTWGTDEASIRKGFSILRRDINDLAHFTKSWSSMNHKMWELVQEKIPSTGVSITEMKERRRYQPYLQQMPYDGLDEDNSSDETALQELLYRIRSKRYPKFKKFSGKMKDFRPEGWRSPFSNNLKTWEIKGKRKRGTEIVKFGAGVDMVEF